MCAVAAGGCSSSSADSAAAAAAPTGSMARCGQQLNIVDAPLASCCVVIVHLVSHVLICMFVMQAENQHHVQLHFADVMVFNVAHNGIMHCC
jgi:hypothetical protein